MKTAGIIAEYNPFHNGHKYHIEKTKELTGCDYVVVIMSGDYTQRGTPAIYSKYTRAKAALLAGADLVLEMPVFGSVASAPDFAECGVHGLFATGLCDYLVFGSEAGSLDELQAQAFSLENETKEISEQIRLGLKNGLSWPAARARAYEHASQDELPSPVASLPNDILGIEYLRTIRKLDASIVPVTIKRTDPGYHSETQSGKFASATAARKAILENNLDFLTETMPVAFFQALEQEPCPPVTFHDCSLLLGEKLLCTTQNDLTKISGMPTDLANKLYKHRLDFEFADALIAARKDKNFTYTRINRCLLNLILGITKNETSQFKQLSSVPWLRILGFRKDAGPLLSELKKKANVPVITKIAAAESVLSEPASALFTKHLQSAEIYRLLMQMKSGKKAKNEFQRSVILV